VRLRALMPFLKRFAAEDTVRNTIELVNSRLGVGELRSGEFTFTNSPISPSHQLERRWRVAMRFRFLLLATVVRAVVVASQTQVPPCTPRAGSQAR